MTERGYVRIIDVGSGPVVLFLHGLLYDAEVWRFLVSALARRYRCIAVDLPGHGDTPRGSCTMSMDNLAAWTLRLLDDLGIESCHVVGFSMGGFVGLRPAIRAPERVRTLCLIGSNAGTESEAFRKKHLRTTIVGLVTAKAWVFRRSVYNTIKGNFFAPGYVENNDTGKWWMKRLMRYKCWPAVLATRHVLTRPSVVSELHRLTQPVLVVRGELDAVRSPDDADVIKSHVPHARCVEITGSGHSVPVERPEALLEHLEPFLDSAEQNCATTENTTRCPSDKDE